MDNLIRNVDQGKEIIGLLEIYEDCDEKFWLRLAEAAAGKCNKMVVDIPHIEEEMNLDQAIAFGKKTMMFGAHQGKQIQDLELSYLCNITDPSDFMKQMKRYTKWRAKNEH